tara:strand:+ start:3722 stop:4510 length:789 start_codon:yes stop_codon:yes gene_type:complete
MLTSSNKKLLSQLLTDHPLQKQNSSQFHQVLQEHMERIHRRRFDYNNNLMLMNKELLRIFSHISIPPPTTTPAAPSPTSATSLLSQTSSIQKLNIGPLVDKQAIMNKRMEKHKKHFDELIQGKKPAEIDFRDKLADPPIRQHDSIMAEREQALKNIMTSYQSNQQEASKWISGDEHKIVIDSQGPAMKTEAIVLSSTPSALSTSKDTSSNEKHVTFQVDNQADKANFLNKIKRPNIEELLTTILQNQEKILALLQSKESKVD